MAGETIYLTVHACWSDMIELDSVLKKSLANASSHTQKVYGQNPLTGQEIIDMVNSRGLMTLASTIGLNDRPHLSPADVVGLDGRFS